MSQYVNSRCGSSTCVGARFVEAVGEQGSAIAVAEDRPDGSGAEQSYTVEQWKQLTAAIGTTAFSEREGDLLLVTPFQDGTTAAIVADPTNEKYPYAWVHSGQETAHNFNIKELSVFAEAVAAGQFTVEALRQHNGQS